MKTIIKYNEEWQAPHTPTVREGDFEQETNNDGQPDSSDSVEMIPRQSQQDNPKEPLKAGDKITGPIKTSTEAWVAEHELKTLKEKQLLREKSNPLQKGLMFVQDTLGTSSQKKDLERINELEKLIAERRKLEETVLELDENDFPGVKVGPNDELRTMPNGEVILIPDANRK